MSGKNKTKFRAVEPGFGKLGGHMGKGPAGAGEVRTTASKKSPYGFGKGKKR